MAKQQLPGEVVHATRVCADNKFRLKPDHWLTRLFAFLVFFFAQKFGMEMHAGVLMANHYHLYFTDWTALRDKFLGSLNATLSRWTKRERGITGHFWNQYRDNDFPVLDKRRSEQTIVYIVTNPVRAGIVKDYRDYDGWILGPCHWGKKIEVLRPPKVLRRIGIPSLTVTVSPPSVFGGEELEVVRRRLEGQIQAEQARIDREFTRERVAQGIPIEEAGDWATGTRYVRSLPSEYSPVQQTKGKRKRVDFASADPVIRDFAKSRKREFDRRYEAGKAELKAGGTPMFPPGTIGYQRAGIATEPVTDPWYPPNLPRFSALALERMAGFTGQHEAKSRNTRPRQPRTIDSWLFLSEVQSRLEASKVRLSHIWSHRTPRLRDG